MTEHGKDENSSVFKHLLTCLPNQSVFRSLKSTAIRFLARDSDPINLRLKEALLIRQHQPGLNSREEAQELMNLLY